MLKFCLILSALLSFWFFVAPASLSGLFRSSEKVLGVENFNQNVNRRTVYTAVLAFCLENYSLPKNLNELYEKELDQKWKVDLNKLYSLKIENEKDCSFALEGKESI